MSRIILFHNIHSPPSRMAYLTVCNLDANFEIEIRDLDILKGEQNTSEFLKINPMHQVPTLVHDEYIVTEGRAIMMYLATLANSSLYPTSDLKQKTLIDSRLFFDATNCSLAVKNFAVSMIY
jgi:glutathione S-transferase